jgi:hypothetical protein
MNRDLTADQGRPLMSRRRQKLPLMTIANTRLISIMNERG